MTEFDAELIDVQASVAAATAVWDKAAAEFRAAMARNKFAAADAALDLQKNAGSQLNELRPKLKSLMAEAIRREADALHKAEQNAAFMAAAEVFE